ncbi:MAG TPA: NUDIX domain-containing protein [Candidatus Saccharimonadales bacterium]|nr:NUDIX domain-containing protein [Candidatus Saccharimonadales bacterium]
MLEEVFARYLKVYPEDEARLDLLAKQLAAKEDLNGRTNYTGHVTGSSLIFSPDLKKVLLIYHPTFSRWQQPGGHWDEGEIGPWRTAERETEEEVGLKIKVAPLADPDDLRVPVDIDSHWVRKTPPKNEPDHHHHDFKYAVIHRSGEVKTEDEVIKEAEWVDVETIEHADLKRAIGRAQRLLRLKA